MYASFQKMYCKKEIEPMLKKGECYVGLFEEKPHWLFLSKRLLTFEPEYVST